MVGQSRQRLTTSHIDRTIHRWMISNRRKSAKEMGTERKSEYGITIKELYEIECTKQGIMDV